MAKPGNRIFINGITLENAHLVPLLLNIRHWQSKSCLITFLGNTELEKKIKKLKIIRNYRFIRLKNTKKITSKFELIIEGLRRNFIALSYISRIKNNYHVIYSRSSVLDLIIFPYILKKFDKKIKWATVFDNTVSFEGPGSLITRILAWVFFLLGLMILRKADYIFTGSTDLKDYLLEKGFNQKRIILTGFAVEADLIRRTKRRPKYHIDALFVGRINEAKGIYDLLEVVELVKKQYPDFQLRVMGEGDVITEKKYNNEIIKRGLKKNVKLLGYKAGLEKFKIIKGSKLFLFLSRSESFGIALFEAVCCGIPALAYDLPAYRKIYQNGEVFFFKICDYHSIAGRIKEIIDKELFENKKGKLLLPQYSWEKIAAKEYNVFKVKETD